MSQYRTKLLILSQNFSNVMINNTSTDEAYFTHAREHALVGWLSGRLDLSVRPCGRARGAAGVGVVYQYASGVAGVVVI
jgi:hypothetical protein